MGRDFHGTGRLYLVGGAQMVQAGLRRQTQAIDYTVRLYDVYQEPFSLASRALIRELEINVEPASPGDFIPLPSGWEGRSPFLGRYGGLDVFAFDPVSTALAKIERGTAQDIDDVIALLSVGRPDLAELTRAFDEILPRLERESLRIDEDDFRRKFAAFLHLLAAPGPGDTPAQP